MRRTMQTDHSIRLAHLCDMLKAQLEELTVDVLHDGKRRRVRYVHRNWPSAKDRVIPLVQSKSENRHVSLCNSPRAAK